MRTRVRSVLRQRELFARIGRWGLVGASGLVVNSIAMAAITAAGVPYLLAAVAATEVSTTWNFVGSEWWAFSGLGSKGRFRRFMAFFLMNNAALAVRGPVIWVLTEVGHLHPTVSNALSLVLVMAVRFAVADNLIWERQRRTNQAVSVQVQEI